MLKILRIACSFGIKIEFKYVACIVTVAIATTATATIDDESI